MFSIKYKKDIIHKMISFFVNQILQILLKYDISIKNTLFYIKLLRK